MDGKEMDVYLPMRLCGELARDFMAKKSQVSDALILWPMFSTSRNT
jgi:hypothetical protein